MNWHLSIFPKKAKSISSLNIRKLTMLPSPGTMAYSISLLVPASRSVADIPEKTVVPTGADCNANKNNTSI